MSVAATSDATLAAKITAAARAAPTIHHRSRSVVTLVVVVLIVLLTQSKRDTSRADGARQRSEARILRDFPRAATPGAGAS